MVADLCRGHDVPIDYVRILPYHGCIRYRVLYSNLLQNKGVTSWYVFVGNSNYTLKMANTDDYPGKRHPPCISSIDRVALYVIQHEKMGLVCSHSYKILCNLQIVNSFVQ